jgi:hypothetical protein
MIRIQDFLVNIITGAATGAITAGIGVRFALSRFRSERTWERKAASYSEIFDSLYHVQKYAKMELRRIEEGAQFDDSYAKELGHQASLAYDAIRKAAIKGTFVVGEAAAKMLNEIVDAFDEPNYNNDRHDDISADLATATKAIDDLRRLAAKDMAN